MPLEDYERSVLAALHPNAAVTDPAVAVIRDSVRRWARLQLASMCPLTTRLLALDGRCEREIDLQLEAGARPCSIHRWSHAFLARLSGHADPFVVDVARFELCVRGTRNSRRARLGTVVDVDRPGNSRRRPPRRSRPPRARSRAVPAPSAPRRRSMAPRAGVTGIDRGTLEERATRTVLPTRASCGR